MLFRDHEIYVRTGGSVKFLRLSASLQRRVASITAVVVGLWMLVTIGLLSWQSYDGWHNRDIASRAVAVEQAEARVAADSAHLGQTIYSLTARQRYIEGVVERHLTGGTPATPAAATSAPAPAPQVVAPADRVSQLQTIRSHQLAMIHRLTDFANRRAVRAETALRALGISANPGAQGGPLIPFDAGMTDQRRDPVLQPLAIAVARMDALEDMVVALPSNLPADHINLSSGFGYRRDPFTGAAAMHAGLDFAGAWGSQIRAAAAGTIIFVGQKSGYGNVVEIDHGHGIVTRYAHLSGFEGSIGQHVAAGQNIARMGSTGRSTGTHLHFEVRVNGNAVNPRQFLEANPDVLEVKADVGQRGAVHVAAR